MIYKSHLVELWINGVKMELEDQKSLGMRFNNTLIDPTKISSKQAEYSFEFQIPSTPKNDRVLDYANNLSKLNKFHQRYKAEVIADGTVIFSGTITINKFKDKKYTCNLVSVKVYSLEDIFGEMTMNKIKDWYIPFNGIPTINEYNAFEEPEVTFPLISYGVFMKQPKFKDEVAAEYTSKFDIDEYNDFYVTSFYPSHNVMKTVKKAFESVGYNVSGDAFKNPFIKNVYMSTNLADDQAPTYNLGNKYFGEVSMNVNWTTPSSGVPYTQSLKFPYWRCGGTFDINNQTVDNSQWNFGSIEVYDMLAESDGGNYTMGDKTYMFHPDNTTIVIPADGWYKIELDALATLSPSQSAFTAAQYCKESQYSSDWEETDVTIPVSFKTTMPLEIQLVRNYDDDIELISGKNKYFTKFGYPNDNTKWNINNRLNVTTCFPHERLGLNWVSPITSNVDPRVVPPTEINELGTANVATIINGGSASSSIYVTDCTLGYVYKDGTPMMYDQAVSPAFICGFTSLGNDNGGGCAAIMRNGRSWSYTKTENQEAFYNQEGYDRLTTTMPVIGTDWDNIFVTSTEYNKNEYLNAPSGGFSESDNQGNRRFQGQIYCMVYLNRNDKLKLFAIQREYENTNGIRQRYQVSAIANLKITAASPKYGYELRESNYGYRSESQFDKNLNLANFLNEETKISDWVQNVADAFNLEILQDGKNVELNVKKKSATPFAAVDIDNRTNSDEAEAEAIDYPRTMAVKYKIDADEWCFEQTAEKKIKVDDTIPDTVLDDDDEWKKYGDSGYTIIKLNDDSYATSSSEKQTQFSYTWYENFNWYPVSSGRTKESETSVTLKLPCISKYEYMIDGYDYEESMKHDGYSLTQRFWFKPTLTNQWVWTCTYPREQVYVAQPSNVYASQGANLNLSYKVNEDSLLTRFFNINAYLASNYVEVDVYLNPEEYNMIKSGSLVHFDSDLYIPVEISGYDPSGSNPTTLKIMKKVN